MFWSCNDEKTCGKNKDKCSRAQGIYAKFDVDEIIDPCADDPDGYLFFVTDGTVRTKDGLNEGQQKKANETLRVFCIAESSYLRKSREDAVEPYIRMVRWLLDNAPDKLGLYAASELAKAEELPFSAAIRQFFRDYSH